VRVVAWIVVAGVSFLSGGFAIPIGFALGLPAIEVYLAATLGSMAGLVVFLFAGDRIRARLIEGDAEEQPPPEGAIRRIADRYGAKGLGLVGPIFPGVTASVVIALGLRLPRGEIARWMSAGIAVMFALYTTGLWLLVEVVGLD
jgi:hypothetical protein